MARFAEVRKHQKGIKRRAAKEAASSNVPRNTPSIVSAQRVTGAIKPTTQRVRGRHLMPYEPDPLTCDLRDLAMLAEDALLDLADEEPTDKVA